MTKLLEQALEAVRELSPEEQDEIARTIFSLVDYANELPVALSAAERAVIDRSKQQADRGEFATEEEIEAIWAKYA